MSIEDTVRGLVTDVSGRCDVPDDVVKHVTRELMYDHLDRLCDTKMEAPDAKGPGKAS